MQVMAVGTELAVAVAHEELARDRLVLGSARRIAFLALTLTFSWRRATLSFVKVWTTWLVTLASILVVVTNTLARFALCRSLGSGPSLPLALAFVLCRGGR